MHNFLTMGLFYKKKNNGDWHEPSDWIANANWEYKAEQFSEDTDLEDEWLFRPEPPQEYLEWLENQEEDEEE